jgi:deoxycytidylate deaminase
MRILDGIEKEEALKAFDGAIAIAQHALCLQARCGSVIIKDSRIIGSGYNAPPGDREDARRCLKQNAVSSRFKSDKTCCIHAEQRAIADALVHEKGAIAGSRLYFIRLDADGNPLFAGDPYCTICSKAALDAGIAEFVLWREEGVCVYDTLEYNQRSYQY